MKLLITGCIPRSEALFRELEAMGHELLYIPEERVSLSELGIDPAPFEGVVCNQLFLYNDIRDFTSLRFMQLSTAGLDRIPLGIVRERGIELHNAGSVYAVPMAEFAVGGVLQVYKKSLWFAKNRDARLYQKTRDLRELTGKTVCIIGCGHVGHACAERFAAFGCRVIGVNRTMREDPAFERIVPLPELDTVLPDADIVILSIGLTEETAHFFDRSCFARMKSDAVFVNVARGALVEPGALIGYLRENPAASAVIDVYETEPLPLSDPLWDIPNAILTPHNSFSGDMVQSRLNALIAENIRAQG